MKTGIVAVCCAVAVVVAAGILAKPWLTIQHAKPIVVKGYAEQDVVSDAGSISAQVVGIGQTNSEAYERAGESLAKVKELIAAALAGEPEVVELKTTVNEVVKLNDEGNRTNEVDYYRASRTLRVSTPDVHGLGKLSRMLFDLNKEGIMITVGGPDYFVSNLEAVKLELMERATRNGKERAAIMAASSGQQLGSLVSAQQGVIQITKKNSSETASWGVYDTETVDKVVKLVVTLEFEID